MSSIIFTLVGLDGEVVPFTSFKIEAAAPDGVYDPEYIVPAPVIITTDAEGVATVELEATTAPYFITRLSGTIDDFIALKFFVPASSLPIQAEMLYVDLAKHQKLHTDRALYALIETKVAMLHALNLFQLNQGVASVVSVNGLTDVVVLDASDVGADVSGAAATAQAAAVQRANHTGTQLANTISDFSASASAAAPVQSVFGRTGAVTAQNGDYTAAQVGADAAGSAAAAQAAAVQRTNHTGTQLAATISDFNATASAAAPVQSVNGHTGAVTVAEGVSRTTLQSSVLWFEDFLTHQSSLWARVTASSGVATTLANDVSMTGMANACGVLRVVWNTTGGYCTVSTSTTLDNKRTSVTGKTASSLTAMAIDAYPASTTYDFQVFGGWGGFDNTGIAAGTTEAALWYFNKDGLYLYTCTGGVNTTSTIALASSGITADAYFRIRIEYTSTAVNLYVDNVLKLTNTTNIPQTYMNTLSWMVRTASAIADYANANLSLDYIDQQFTFTTPRVLT